jgi:replicative DNA helicase
MSQTINSKDLAKHWIDTQRKKHEHPELYKLKSTGLVSLDNALGGGVEPGQFVLVGGAQKSGKTTLLSCMTEAFAKQGMKILFLSGEMTTLQTANLFFSRMARIDRTRIRSVSLDNDDWVKLDRVAEQFAEFGIWWNHGFSTVSDIDKIVVGIEKSTGEAFDAIIVDYIQLMEAPEIKGKGNRVQELEYISRNLKRRSINTLGNPALVVAATQMNRQSIRGSLYDANSFLGSGSLERDMDIGMIIHSVVDPITHFEDRYQKEIVIVGSRETGNNDGRPIKTFYNGTIALIEDAETEVSSVNMKNRF